MNNFFSLGYKLVFVCKGNEKGQLIHYKAHLVAQGFTQKFGIDYDSIYSPIMGFITFLYLIGMVVHTILEMCLITIRNLCFM